MSLQGPGPVQERRLKMAFAENTRRRSTYWRYREVIGRAIGACHTALEKRRTRRQLSLLDEHGLRDIGVSRQDADREIRKSFAFFLRSG